MESDDLRFIEPEASGDVAKVRPVRAAVADRDLDERPLRPIRRFGRLAPGPFGRLLGGQLLSGCRDILARLAGRDTERVVREEEAGVGRDGASAAIVVVGPDEP